MRKYIFFPLLAIFFSFAPASDIKSDLVQVSKKLFEASTYRARTHVIFNYTGKKERMEASASYLGRCFSYTTGNYSYLSNKNMQVAVNHEEKMMFVQDAIESDKKEKTDFGQHEKMLDSLMQNNYRYTLVKQEGSYKQVKTELKAPSPYKEVLITYHTGQHCFKEIEFIGGKDMQASGLISVKVVYDEFNFKPGLTEKDFSESIYLNMSGKKIKGPAEKYKGYKVIDQRFER